MSDHSEPQAEATGRYLAILTLTALGVVYGDIGTSPLYAVRECFYGQFAVPISHDNVLGVLSLIFWSLILVISFKYLVFIMRADNRGEGGILALMSLVAPPRPVRALSRAWWLICLGLFGAALLYGDGMITPAISVLSAVEGLGVATHAFDALIIPITVVILVGLFMFQRRGTAGVGVVFGPVMLVWFATLSVLGIRAIIGQPAVLVALLPTHGLSFFIRNRFQGFFVLAAVFLVVTGGEALYADMGHFGRRPIRLGWFSLVLPALLLNYFGQGALLLSHPEAAHNPFYRMAPGWGLYPLVILATAATIIASQAVISGSFSLTMQAVQLGYSPRLRIEHTSATEIGQIYIPGINWILMVATIGLVLGFKTSSNLAAAYGVAVTTTMVITTLIFFVLATRRWQWSRLKAGALCGFFLCFDLSFFGANLLKVADGGWFPLLVAAAVFTALTTWKRGREILRDRLAAAAVPLDFFRQNVTSEKIIRVPGTAVFMTGNADFTPPALLHHLKHTKVLHQRVVVLTALTEEIPRVPERERLDLENLGDGFYRITMHYGFMEDPDLPRDLALARSRGLEFKPMETSYFLGRERLIASKRRAGMALWRERLFAFLSRNSQPATAFFHLPSNRVVELGAQIEL
jgi:KUP system potassium uptake protein